MRGHPLVTAEQARDTSASWARTPKTEQRLAWRPRIYMHFTPPHASWLNQLEV